MRLANDKCFYVFACHWWNVKSA